MARFEISLNKKTKKFNSGYALWKWVNNNSQGKLETNFDEKNGPFLCDFFQRRWENKQKQIQQKRNKKK